MKLNETTYEKFEKKVISKFHVEVEEISKKNSKIVSEIVRKVWEDFQSYEEMGCVNRTGNILKDKLSEVNAIQMKGLLLGARDFKNSRSPTIYALIGAKGWNLETKVWGNNVKMPDGTKVRVPQLAFVDVNIVKGEYNGVTNYELKSINGAKKLKEATEIIRLLKKMDAIITTDDLVEKKQYQTVAVTGTINSVYPSKDFDSNLDDALLPILTPLADEPALASVPTMALGLKKSEKDTSVTVYLEKRRKVVPDYLITDFAQLLQDATKRYTDPEDQIEFVSGTLVGKRVVVVGSIGNIKEPNDANPGWSVSLKAFSIFEVPEEEEITSPKSEPVEKQKELLKEKVVEPPEIKEEPQEPPKEPEKEVEPPEIEINVTKESSIPKKPLKPTLPEETETTVTEIIGPEPIDDKVIEQVRSKMMYALGVRLGANKGQEAAALRTAIEKGTAPTLEEVSSKLGLSKYPKAALDKVWKEFLG